MLDINADGGVEAYRRVRTIRMVEAYRGVRTIRMVEAYRGFDAERWVEWPIPGVVVGGWGRLVGGSSLGSLPLLVEPLFELLVHLASAVTRYMLSSTVRALGLEGFSVSGEGRTVSGVVRTRATPAASR